MGKEHDFEIFKKSKLPINRETLVIVDTGYLGIVKFHKKSLLPIKSSKNHKLSKQDKQYNQIIAKMRIKVEHVIRYIKRFRMFSEKYRNKHTNFKLRFNLICGICNYQL